MTKSLHLTLLLFAALLLGCNRGTTPVVDGGTQEPKNVEGGVKEKPKTPPFTPVTTVVRPDLASAAPDYVLNAKELKKEWKVDSKAAREKYEGKILEITGYVDQVTSVSVVVCASPNRYSVTEVAHCLAPRDKVNRIQRLGNGQKVKVLTKNISMGIFVDLISITELEPSNLIETTAEELTKEFEKAPVLAEKKYKDKDLAVSGRIKELKKGELSHQVSLVGANNTSVNFVAFDDLEKWEGKTNVEVRVSFAAYNSDRRQVEVYGFLMAPK